MALASADPPDDELEALEEEEEEEELDELEELELLPEEPSPSVTLQATRSVLRNTQQRIRIEFRWFRQVKISIGILWIGAISQNRQCLFNVML